MKALKKKIFGYDPFEGFQTEWADPDLTDRPNDYGLLLDAVRTLKPRIVIVAGVRKGVSAIEIAKVCKAEGLNTEIICVDTWLGSSADLIHDTPSDQRDHVVNLRQVNGFPMLYYTFMRNVIDAGVQDYITPLPQINENAAKILRHYHAEAELIYVDTGQETQPLYRDLMFCWPRLRSGGKMIGNFATQPSVKASLKKFTGRVGTATETIDDKYLVVKP